MPLFNRPRHSDMSQHQLPNMGFKTTRRIEDRTELNRGHGKTRGPPRMRLEAPGGNIAPGQHAHRSVRTRAARRCAHSAITIGASTAIDSSAIGMPIALCIESKEPLCSVAPAVAGVSVVASAIAPAAAELSAQSIW